MSYHYMKRHLSAVEISIVYMCCWSCTSYNSVLHVAFCNLKKCDSKVNFIYNINIDKIHPEEVHLIRVPNSTEHRTLMSLHRS